LNEIAYNQQVLAVEFEIIQGLLILAVSIAITDFLTPMLVYEIAYAVFMGITTSLRIGFAVRQANISNKSDY
jgi:hypothetical protein